MNVYFLNVFTSSGGRVQLKHCRSLSKDWALTRKKIWIKKGYKAEVVVSPKNNKAYVLDTNFL